jgi:hypothetical protein
MRSAFLVFTILAVPIVAGLMFALLWRPRRSPGINYGKGALLNRFAVSERRSPDTGHKPIAPGKAGRQKASKP